MYIMINVNGCKIHKNAWAWLYCLTPTFTHIHTDTHTRTLKAWVTVLPAIWLFYYSVANLNPQRRPSAAVENTVTLWTTPIHPPAEALKAWGKICLNDAPRMGDEDALLSCVQWRHLRYTIKCFVSTSFHLSVQQIHNLWRSLVSVCVCFCVPDGLWVSWVVRDCVAPT